MKREWIEICQKLAASKPDYRAGGKKIFRNVVFTFPDPLGPISFVEIGFTPVKMTVLKKNYIHEESRNSALSQWNNRDRDRRAHNSVGFSCYNHILKSHSVDPSNENSSVMGPCLQALTITQTVLGTAEVNVFYRTTEIFKKFPADLVLIRDHLLPGFDFSLVPLGSITFMIANVTVSPNYVIVPLQLSRDPIGFMESIREGDPTFHRASCKWILRLFEGPTQKFNQARRTQNAAKRLMAEEARELLIGYSRNNLGL